MLTVSEYTEARQRAAHMMRAAHILITAQEVETIQVADFGLSRLDVEGAQIVTFVETGRIGVKVIALFPGQTLPEHWHPPVKHDPGKEETFRVIAGTLYVYTAGPNTLREGHLPEGKDAYYTVRHEHLLKPGYQIMVEPGAKHWLQAGTQGAVMYSFSTCARDVLDGFTDPNIVRTTQIIDTPGDRECL